MTFQSLAASFGKLLRADNGGAVNPASTLFYLFFTFCLLNSQAVECFGCTRSQCDPAACKDRTSLRCPSERQILDSCGCCLVCQRDVNETCGGINDSLGICADGLRCLLLPKEEGNLTFQVNISGICQETKDGKCQNVTCSSKPTSCPFDSYLLTNFSDTESCCPEYQCVCLPSACRSMKCHSNHHPKVVQFGTGIPGSCCDTFECSNETKSSCKYKEKVYESGTKWMADRCSICYCENGIVLCKAKTCDETNMCAFMYYPEGECCPECVGCVSPSGNFYNNSVVWKEDDCTTCQCIDGKMNCQTHMCQTKCKTPRVVPGMCCPICDDGLYNQIITNEPQQTKQQQLTLKHSTLNQERCHVESNKEYGPEDMWNDGCRQCYCHNGREMCAVLTCPILSCDHPQIHPNQCCPVCAKDHTSNLMYKPTVCQAVDGRYHVERESWSLDPCTWCICIKGEVLCQATQCPPTPCSHPVHHIGSCCNTCPGEKNSISRPMSYCYSDDGYSVYVEGQHWFATPCKSCVCHQGKIHCYQETCPIVDCVHPLMVKRRCCPVCLGVKNSRTLVCLQNGRNYRDGEHWSANACTTCTCVKGMQMCTEKVCPLWCSRPVHVPGQCCPICETSGYNPTQLTLASVVICATIMVLLVLAIVFLVMAILRQRKFPEATTSCQSVLGQSFCRGQRPKSTNLELQGMSPCTKPLLDSNELKKLHDQGNAVMKNKM